LVDWCRLFNWLNDGLTNFFFWQLLLLRFVLKLVICVKHVRIPATEELNEFAPHIPLLCDILYLHTTLRHKVLDQRISVVLTDSAQLVKYLVSEEVDPFFAIPEFFRLFG
jgi:hypothetical protein